MNICPSAAQLDALILGTLPDSLSDTLTEHIGACEDCQQTIQRLASGEVPVDSLLADSFAAAPPANSAYWNVRASLAGTRRGDVGTQGNGNDRTEQLETRESTPANRETIVDAENFKEDELSFLEPSDDPNYIGRLEHFEVFRVIGRGGMGVVLEAFDENLHRSVAIKVLGEKFRKDKVAIERFCREGRAAAAVSHEHVVQMFQVARTEDSKTAFLVMQFIEGETLDALLKKQSPLNPEDVARIAMQTAAGLSAAHDNELVHRDIKPGNILIEESTQRVKLTDFGLARINDDVKITRTGMLMGTVLYMSPEQSLGQTVDERSDLFSLGAVMYEMATGKSPFDAPTPVGVMKRIMDENPAAPHTVNSAIGKPMSDLIMQLLSKKPNNRPDSAALVARALASIVTEHGPISPLQVPAVASSEVKKLSNTQTIASRTWSIGGWLLAGLMLSALALSAFMGWTPWSTNAGLSSDKKLSVTINSDGNLEDATDSFPSVVLGGNPGTVWCIDFTNDGETIAAGIGDGSVRLWDIEKKELIKSFSAHDGNVWNIEFHPTLDLVATVGDDAWVKLWDSTSFELKHGWKAKNSVRGLAFSPENDTLAVGDRAGKLHIYDIINGQELKTVEQEGTILGVDFSCDGKSIATVGSDKIVRVFDAVTYEQRQSFTGHEGPIYSVAFAHEGPLMASVGWKNGIWVWNTDTGKHVLKLEGLGGDNWGVGFCGRGQHLLTGGQGGIAQLWNLNDGSNIATLRGHTAPVHDIDFDPTRRRIATSSRDGTIRIWDTEALKDLTD